MGTNWEPNGNQIGTKLEPNGNQLGTKWELNGTDFYKFFHRNLILGKGIKNVETE